MFETPSIKHYQNSKSTRTFYQSIFYQVSGKILLFGEALLPFLFRPWGNCSTNIQMLFIVIDSLSCN